MALASSLEQQSETAKRIEKFVQLQLKKQVQRSGKTLEELAKNSRKLTQKHLDIFVDHTHESLIEAEILEEIKVGLVHLMNRVNALPSVKRFYLMETMDFFYSKASIGKLLPPLVILRGEEQKKAICEFLRPIFLSINKNVEILTSTAAIFNSKSIHLERGSLYTLVGDVAKVLLKFFEPEYLDSFTEVNSNVELILTLFEVNPIFQESFDPSNPGSHHVISDPALLRATLMEFIECIQTHEGLYNYSLKRHAYYKLFVTNLLEPGKFQGFTPFEVSQMLAACLWINPQLEPSKSLLEKMLNESEYALSETRQEYNEFMEKLSPATIYRLIGNIRTGMQQINQKGLDDEFSQVQRLAVKNLVKNIWASFITFGEKTLSKVGGAFRTLFSAIKSSFEGFLKSEGQTMPKPKPKTAESLISKSERSSVLLQGEIEMVATDVKAFRGEYDGASLKDQSYNARIFQQDEMLLFRFRHCFERLFKVLQSSKYLEIFAIPNNPAVKEYYLAFRMKDHLLAIGMTHLKSMSMSMIQPKDLFGYVLLFEKGQEKSYGRVLSREVAPGEIYNEVGMTALNAKMFYEGLYHIFHHLPEKDWNSKEVQLVLRFLISELIKAKEGFLFLDAPPSLG